MYGTCLPVYRFSRQGTEGGTWTSDAGSYSSVGLSTMVGSLVIIPAETEDPGPSGLDGTP